MRQWTVKNGPDWVSDCLHWLVNRGKDIYTMKMCMLCKISLCIYFLKNKKCSNFSTFMFQLYIILTTISFTKPSLCCSCWRNKRSYKRTKLKTSVLCWNLVFPIGFFILNPHSYLPNPNKSERTIMQCCGPLPASVLFSSLERKSTLTD